MKIKKLFHLSTVLAVTIFLVFAFQLATVHATSYYTVTPKVTQAVEDYLNEIYIEKYPEMGFEFTSGTERDKQVLMTLADIITEDCKTDAEKAMSIAQWVDRNIAYQSLTGETWYLAIDVFHERVGNCVGTAQLISQLMRLEGIPAVMCSGFRGDMINVLELETPLEIGHSWTMAYVDGTWQLYDPLFDEFGLTDKDYISKWYFTDDMEGVSPYYEGMDTKIMYEGHAIYYINGRFMNYDGGVPTMEHENPWHWGGAAGKVINNAVSYI
ncbi:MAG: transglutaminase domain-containing protein [Firmicutes bacterium]|nr:transglutaminase domain-containing protein [Bacillota bacterium]